MMKLIGLFLVSSFMAVMNPQGVNGESLNVVEIEKLDTTENTEDKIAIEYSTGFDCIELDGNHVFYIIDTYNKDVIVDNGYSSTRIPIKETILPSDIVVNKDYIFIYDDVLRSLVCFSHDGDLLHSINVPLCDVDFVSEIKPCGTSILLRTYTEKAFILNTINWVCYEIKITKNNYAESEYDSVYLECVDDNGYRYYVRDNMFEDMSILCGETTIIKTDRKGLPEGYYTVPMLSIEALPDDFVDIMPDGTTYVMLSLEDKYVIQKVVYSKTQQSYENEIREEMSKIAQSYSDRRKKVRKLNVTISRDEVIDIAEDMINYEFTLSINNIKRLKDSEIPKEYEYLMQFGDITKPVRGIPYSWGGCNTLQKSTSVYGTFPEGLRNGKNAGNTDTHGYIKMDTIGLDCSSYVGASYGLAGKTNTTALLGVGKPLSSIKDVKYADMLLNPGAHVILIHDIKGHTILTSEAAVREGKVAKRVRNLREFFTGKYQMISPW